MTSVTLSGHPVSGVITGGSSPPCFDDWHYDPSCSPVQCVYNTGGRYMLVYTDSLLCVCGAACNPEFAVVPTSQSSADHSQTAPDEWVSPLPSSTHVSWTRSLLRLMHGKNWAADQQSGTSSGPSSCWLW